LLVVIAVIAILAALLLPALSFAKLQATGVHCLNNLKELQVDWFMYAGDNKDCIAGNVWTEEASHSPSNWLSGWEDAPEPDDPDNTNTALFMNVQYAQLGPYVQSPNLFRLLLLGEWVIF
jgi:type II secretory pathway pseudopilin PulG